MQKVILVSRLLALISAARANLARYEGMGDARAVEAGRKMVEALEKELSRVCLA